MNFANLRNNLGTGIIPSVLAGRLSYTYGFTGPSMVVNTACSSSLVALHYACTSLGMPTHTHAHIIITTKINKSLIENGECDAAIVGGVNLMLSPELSLDFWRSGMLSPDGRCKTYSDDANGYVRSEGCAVLVAKRLSDAERDGDSILMESKREERDRER